MYIQADSLVACQIITADVDPDIADCDVVSSGAWADVLVESSAICQGARLTRPELLSGGDVELVGAVEADVELWNSAEIIELRMTDDRIGANQC